MRTVTRRSSGARNGWDSFPRYFFAKREQSKPRRLPVTTTVEGTSSD
jgi:hypothetical protein